MKTQSILKLAVASLVILALAGCRKEKPAPQPEPPRPQPEVPEFTEGLMETHTASDTTIMNSTSR